jgi:tight adherence protein C
MTLLIPLALFIVLVAAIFAFGYSQLAHSGQVAQRLSDSGDGRIHPDLDGEQRFAGAAQFLGKMGNLLPASPQETRVLRKGLIAAGFRRESAAPMFYGLRMVGLVGFLILDLLFRGRFIPNPGLSIVSIFAAPALGYFLPGLVLDWLIGRRSTRLRLALPDMLDLLTIATEAGSALDQAILHVCRELRLMHPEISEELSIVNLEMVAGKSRVDALRDLGERNREPELRKLMAILIQTDRFGTSIADALRSQSDFLRIRRRQAAQERAGKLGVKIIFPIFFFCFPALLILVAGPGMLALFKHVFPMMRGIH